MDKLDKLIEILSDARDKLLSKALPKMPDVLSTHDHAKGPTKPDTPARQAAIDHINALRTSGVPGGKAEALRVYQQYVAGKPGDYTRGVDEKGNVKKDEVQKDVNYSDEVPERSTFYKNGQWKIEKVSEVPNKALGINEQIGNSAPTETPNAVQGTERKI